MEFNELEELIGAEKKVGIFDRIIKSFGKKPRKPKKPKKSKNDSTRPSKFDEFIKEVNPKDPAYETVVRVAGLCDEAVIIAREKLNLEGKLQVLEEEIKEVSAYELLGDEDIEYLKEMLERYTGLSQDRSALRYQITGFDRGLEKMQGLEEDAKAVLDNVRDAERMQRIFKHDLMHLEGEKNELQYERDNLTSASDFIYRFSIGLVALFATGLTAIVFLHIFRDMDVFFPVAVMSIVLIFVISAIYLFKNYVHRQLRFNLRKQHKAVELINKKSVVYAYYSNFLTFIYKKYDVRNSDKLSQNIKDYENYKYLVTRYDAIRDMLYRTEGQIDFFMKDKSIENTAVTLESFAKTVNIDDKRKYFKELTTERDRLAGKVKDLEERHASIWNDLVLINEEIGASKVIDAMMQRYIDEVGKLVDLKLRQEEEEEIVS